MCVRVHFSHTRASSIRTKNERNRGYSIQMITGCYHQTRQKTKRHNECSCQRDHAFSSGTRDDELLDTQVHSLSLQTTDKQPGRFLKVSRQTTSKQWMYVHVPTHDFYTNDARNAVSSRQVCTPRKKSPTPKPFEMQLQIFGAKLQVQYPGQTHAPLTTEHSTNVRRRPNFSSACAKSIHLKNLFNTAQQPKSRTKEEGRLNIQVHNLQGINIVINIYTYIYLISSCRRREHVITKGIEGQRYTFYARGALNAAHKYKPAKILYKTYTRDIKGCSSQANQLLICRRIIYTCICRRIICTFRRDMALKRQRALCTRCMGTQAHSSYMHQD